MESITEHQLNSESDTLRFIVGYPADIVLGAAQLHFARDWPDEGRVQRKLATVEFRGDGVAGGRRERRRRRSARLLGTMTLGILTLGLYPIGRLLSRRRSAEFWAEVFCREEEDGTFVAVSAGRERYMRLLRVWIKEELGGQPIPSCPVNSDVSKSSSLGSPEA